MCYYKKYKLDITWSRLLGDEAVISPEEIPVYRNNSLELIVKLRHNR